MDVDRSDIEGRQTRISTSPSFNGVVFVESQLELFLLLDCVCGWRVTECVHSIVMYN